MANRTHGVAPMPSSRKKIVTPTIPELVIKELVTRRDILMREFERNPQRLDLCLRIKALDDEVARRTEQIRGERTKRTQLRSNPDASVVPPAKNGKPCPVRSGPANRRQRRQETTPKPILRREVTDRAARHATFGNLQ